MSTTISDRDTLTQDLAIRAWKDPVFRDLLQRDPKAALEEHLGQPVPEEVAVVTHTEDAGTIHLVLPHLPQERAVTDEQIEWLMDEDEKKKPDSHDDCSREAQISTCTCTWCCNAEDEGEDEESEKEKNEIVMC